MFALKAEPIKRGDVHPLCRLILLVTAFMTTNVNATEVQYICTFTSSIKVTVLSSTAPSTKVEKIDQRYTFLLSHDGGASYINLNHGVKVPLTAIVDKYQTIFIERANSDNLFVVTVFNSKNKDNKYPAIYSFSAWKEDSPSFYYPSMDFGSCIKTN